MSRHRNVRNMRLEDELEQDEDVDYEEEEEEYEQMSPETSRFLYHRAEFGAVKTRPSMQQTSRIDDEEHFEDIYYGDEQQVFEMDPVEETKKSTKPQQQKSATAKAQKETIALLPAVENLRVTEAAKTRANSKSPARVATPKEKSNLEVAQSALLNYRQRVRPAGAKQALNLIIVGHVDAGKSTLVGHLLYLMGNVEERMMHKYRQESSRLGKASFAFAWILDESEEERNRGITMDIARTSFESTSGRRFNILDAPGHKDFIPNMISGASQADAALLVVNATRGEFESGFDQGGQTREHALLIRALGVSRLVVAVNKLDTVDWSRDRYEELCAVLSAFLVKRAGFESATFVPVSGLLGTNLAQPPSSDHPLHQWYTEKQTLVEALDSLPLSSRPEEHWLRILVNDVVRFTPQALVVSAKVESGHVEPADRLFLMPDAIPVSVKAIASDDAPSNGPSVATTPAKSSGAEKVFFAGDQITLTLSGAFEPDTVFPGHVLLRGGKELLQPCRRLRARIVTFDIRTPILKGTRAELFVHALRVPCTIAQLLTLHPGSKQMEKRNPRLLPRNVSALVEVHTESGIPVEPFARTKSLGRLAMRAQGETIAAGIVEQCFY